MENVTIQSSKNYSQFKLRKGNRGIDVNHVNSLANLISENGYIKGKPILVNEDFEIIDGQHRFYACKSIGCEVYFVVHRTNGTTDQLMIDLNIKQKNWMPLDYVKYFAAKGISVYKEFLEYYNKNDFTYSISLTLFSSSRHNQIKEGNLKKRGYDYEAATECFKDYVSIFSFTQNRFFAQAFIILFNNKHYQHHIHFEKIKKNRFLCSECGNVVQYLMMFESIINKGNSRNFISLL